MSPVYIDVLFTASCILTYGFTSKLFLLFPGPSIAHYRSLLREKEEETSPGKKKRLCDRRNLMKEKETGKKSMWSTKSKCKPCRINGPRTDRKDLHRSPLTLHLVSITATVCLPALPDSLVVCIPRLKVLLAPLVR